MTPDLLLPLVTGDITMLMVLLPLASAVGGMVGVAAKFLPLLLLADITLVASLPAVVVLVVVAVFTVDSLPLLDGDKTAVELEASSGLWAVDFFFFFFVVASAWGVVLVVGLIAAFLSIAPGRNMRSFWFSN